MAERPLGSFDSLKFVASGGFDVYVLFVPKSIFKSFFYI